MPHTALSATAVYLLDVGAEVYVWSGKHSNLAVRLAGVRVANHIIQHDDTRPMNACITQVWMCACVVRCVVSADAYTCWCTCVCGAGLPGWRAVVVQVQLGQLVNR